MVIVEDEESNWIKKIDYIVDGSCPPNKSEVQTLRRKAMKYCMFGQHLYKRLFLGSLMRCLRLNGALNVMVEMHEGFCGNHMVFLAQIVEGFGAICYKSVRHVRNFPLYIMCHLMSLPQ